MKARWLAGTLAGACVAFASLLPIQDAQACGGCFIPPMTPGTVVTGHRMVLSVSTAQTVLWDQIQYSGDPAEFAWVLPVKPGAYIEVATDAFFETLEAATNVSVLQPAVQCRDPYGFDGPGCGTSYKGDAEPMAAFANDEGSTGAGQGAGPTVEVIKRVTVGPYDSVTLSTSTPGALNDWLTNAGYNIDPVSQPIIDAYVAEGFDFIALKLKPETGVREMKPVRVISPGASPTLPLRMVAVGTGANVAVTLYLIAEGRFGAQNFPNAQVPIDLLAWDFGSNRSNYAELREQTLKAADGGSAWITTYAKQGPLLGSIASPTGFGNVAYGFDEFGPMTTIAELFLSQAILNKETSSDTMLSDDAQCRQNFAELDSTVGPSTSLVSNPCPMGAPFNDPACGVVAPGEIDARLFACGAATDLALAVTGMHPKDVWLTRLETNLPQSALKSDLTLEPAMAQSEVDNLMRARIAVNADSVCGGGSYTPPSVWSKGIGDRGALAGFTITAIACAAALARRRIRRFA